MRIAMESPGQGVGAAGLVELLRHGVGFGLIVDQAGIHVTDGAHFEFSGDQAFDQGVLDFVEGLETVAELVEELEEFLGIGIGREELAGGHAVDQAVAAGDGFALRAAGSGAFLRVLPVGVGLRCGCHDKGSFV